MKTEMSGAPPACCAEEFSLLLAAMLKPAQLPGASFENVLVEASGSPAPEDGALEKPLAPGLEPAKTIEVKEGGKAASEVFAAETPLKNLQAGSVVSGALEKPPAAGLEPAKTIEVKEGGKAASEVFAAETPLKNLQAGSVAFGALEKPPAAGLEPAETFEVKEGEKAAPETPVTEAPLNLFTNEFVSFAAAKAAVQSPLSAPSVGYHETGLTQKTLLSVPSNAYLPNQLVQGRVIAGTVAEAFIAAETGFAGTETDGVNSGSGQMKNLPEKTGAAFSEKSRVEPASGLFADGAHMEHFEIEIPAEEILKQAALEPEAGPALAASFAVAEAPDENPALSQVFEQEPAGRSENSGKAEKGLIDQVRGQQADLSGFTFQGSEDREQNGRGALANANSQPVQDKEGAGTENIMNALIEKQIGTLVNETAPAPVKASSLAAEVQEKVQAGIKVSLEQGGGEVKMKLNPESLGEVRIKLNVASGVVRAEIIVESAEVKRILESDSAFLRDSLGGHGLTLDKCVVEVCRPFDAARREGNGESALSGDEQRPMKDRDEKENRENSGWHRHFRQNYGRHEDGGVDFFI